MWTIESRAERPLFVLASIALTIACEAHIVGTAPDAGLGAAGGGDTPGEMPANGAATGSPPATSLPEASACRDDSPGPRALRRLTAAEYSASIQDLFGDPNVPLTTVFNDPDVLGFRVDNRALVVQGLGAQQLMDQADSVAKWAVANKLGQLASCQSYDANCRQQFIRQFGKRVHRAPLSDEDFATYEALFTAEASFNDGVEAVTAAMLQSPYFLYRRELGTKSGEGYELTPHELASSLSYLFTGSLPDDALLAAADAGTLSGAALEMHAERLLQSPRGHQAVGRFMRDWLGLGKLETIAKDDTVFKLSDSLRLAMGEETRRFIEEGIFNQRASFADLLTTRSSFVNRELGQHYGLASAGSLGEELAPITFQPNERDGGLLAQGSLLTALATARESSPVQRGKMVRVRLLCQDIPPPPANIDTTLKPSSGGVTTRDHFNAHSQNPACASCHRLMDPIGFGFEQYDAFGRRREQENGQNVDTSGVVVSPEGASEVAFTGLPGLTEYLTGQAGDTVNACLIRYWSYFAFGTPGWEQDQCTYDAISTQAGRDGYAVQSIVKAIVQTARFSRRVADP